MHFTILENKCVEEMDENNKLSNTIYHHSEAALNE